MLTRDYFFNEVFYIQDVEDIPISSLGTSTPTRCSNIYVKFNVYI